MKIVEVTWDDASYESAGGPRTHKYVENIKNFRLRSVGFLVCRDKKNIKLAMEYEHEEGTVRDVLVIPMSLVRKVRVLDRGAPR